MTCEGSQKTEVTGIRIIDKTVQEKRGKQPEIEDEDQRQTLD